MITRKEIKEHSERHTVPPDTIDKDWVLGHFLNILFKQDWAQENLVFKGGTCLRKCFFDNYRFSEDLDLSVLKSNFQLTRKHINTLCVELTEQVDIPCRIMSMNQVLFQDLPVGWDIEICYWGANHNPSSLPIFRNTCHTRILLEIRSYETVILDPILRPIIHHYSDSDQIHSNIRCYHIHEILSEKMRALLQRKRGEARDYFDLWYIYKNLSSHIDWDHVIEMFKEKCIFKKIEFNSVDQFFEQKRLYQVDITWDKRLAHQLPIMYDKKLVLEEIENFMRSIIAH